MTSTGTRLVGLAVWHGGRWYVRRRWEATRRLRRIGLIIAGALIVAAVLVKRNPG